MDFEKSRRDVPIDASFGVVLVSEKIMLRNSCVGVVSQVRYTEFITNTIHIRVR